MPDLPGARALVLVCACGRIGFDALPVAGDATDAAGVRSCTGGTGAFQLPVLEPELHVDGVDTWAPTLTADRLDIMFSRGGNCPDGEGDCGDVSPTGTIWEATRASLAVPFDPPIERTELEVELNVFRPVMLGDGLTVYFTGYPTHDNNGFIYSATRAARGMPWSAPTQVPVCATGTSDLFGADVTDDALEMFVDPCIGVPQNCSMVHGVWNGATSRFDCTAIENEVGVGTTGTDYREEWPSLTGDRLTLYYVVKTGNAAPIADGIWTAQRSSPSDPLANPTELSWTVASGSVIDTPAITRDDEQLWFASDRANPGGPRDLFVATRACMTD